MIDALQLLCHPAYIAAIVIGGSLGSIIRTIPHIERNHT